MKRGQYWGIHGASREPGGSILDHLHGETGRLKHRDSYRKNQERQTSRHREWQFLDTHHNIIILMFQWT